MSLDDDQWYHMIRLQNYDIIVGVALGYLSLAIISKKLNKEKTFFNCFNRF